MDFLLSLRSLLAAVARRPSFAWSYLPCTPPLALTDLAYPSPPCAATDKRKAEAERIRQKYPDRIPVSRLCPSSSLIPPHSIPSCCAWR